MEPAAQRFFADDGTIPNNARLPVRLYRRVLTGEAISAKAFEELFARHGWTGAWRNGIYDFHHFHSTAHEVLGIADGHVRVRLGGPDGQSFELSAGDVVVLPAGTGHCNEGEHGGLVVVGAYAQGREWDTCRGEPGQAEKVRQTIRALPDPEQDPVTGAPYGPMS